MANKDEAKLQHEAVFYVTTVQGCKAVELAAHGYGPEEIEELVVNGELVEVEYVLPDMNYRVKSFLLPAGTKVTVRDYTRGRQ